MSPLYFPTCQFLSRRAPILTTYILPPNVGYNLPIKKRIPAPKRGYPLIIITVFPPSLRTLFHWLYTALWSLKALMDLGDGVRGSFGDTILREMNHEPRPRGSQAPVGNISCIYLVLFHLISSPPVLLLPD